MNKNSRARIEKVKIKLMLDYIFWGVIASRLQLVEDNTFDTGYTDAKVLGYNDEFIASLTDAQVLFFVAHEVLHVAFGHCFRGKGKDHKIWNEACDYVINLVLHDLGFHLPEGVLLDFKYRDMSAEEVYFILMKDASTKPQKSKQPGQQSPGQSGGSQGKQDQSPSEKKADSSDSSDSSKNSDGKLENAADGHSPNDDPTADKNNQPIPIRGEIRQCDDPNLEKEWKHITTTAAHQAQNRGVLSGSLKRLVQETIAPEIDWKNLTHQFVQQMSPSDYSWSRPNPSYLQMGFYVPSLNETRLGKIYFGNDTSGSISDFQQSCAQSFLRHIMDEIKPESLTVIHCDSQVKKVQEFMEFDKIDISPVGGGGTDFRPVFEKVRKLDESPAGMIFLTDLDGEFPDQEPDYPVLWLSTNRRLVAPFGTTVYLDLRGE